MTNVYISWQASKRRAASKSVNGYPRLGSCSIWIAKPLKSRVRVRVGRVRVRAVYKRTLSVTGRAWTSRLGSN